MVCLNGRSYILPQYHRLNSSDFGVALLLTNPRGVKTCSEIESEDKLGRCIFDCF